MTSGLDQSVDIGWSRPHTGLMTKTEVLVTFHTARGAENYITRLGYKPGVAVKETYWNGSRHVPIVMMFTVTRENGTSGLHQVVRNVESLEA